MGDSTNKKAEKPKKPRPDFPLFAHSMGQWAKKIRGKTRYFGSWDDPDGALENYLQEKDYLQAGKEPPAEEFRLTLEQGANYFYDAKKKKHENDELKVKTLGDYHLMLSRLLKLMGRNRQIATLDQSDFQELRFKLSQTLGPVTLKNQILRIRSFFKWLKDAGKIDREVEFGPDFKPPSRRVLRRERKSKPKRMFTAEQLITLLDGCNERVHLKAMIYLAINGGMGQTDISMMELKHLDLESGWIDFPRPKTYVDRRFPLWPETIEALKDSIEARPKPGPGNSQYVFITKYGNQWVRESSSGTSIDGVSQEFAKLRKECDFESVNQGFYAIRHTFQTVAGGAIDKEAIDYVMGHVNDSISAEYIEDFDDHRLYRVVNYVRDWLAKS